MRYLALAVLAASIAGCSGSSTVPSGTALPETASNIALAVPDGAKICHASATMKPGIAGFIKLPSCFGISGHMQFPKASESGIKITVSESKLGFKPYHKLPETALILQWVFTDPSLPKGTQVVFDYTSTGANAPDKVTGPFKSSKKYYAVFQLPTPNDPKPAGGITIGGTTVGHSVVGVPFPGTEVEIGVKVYEVFTTDANAPQWSRVYYR